MNAGRLQMLTWTRQTSKQMTSRNDRSSSILQCMTSFKKSWNSPTWTARIIIIILFFSRFDIIYIYISITYICRIIIISGKREWMRWMKLKMVSQTSDNTNFLEVTAVFVLFPFEAKRIAFVRTALPARSLPVCQGDNPPRLPAPTSSH